MIAQRVCLQGGEPGERAGKPMTPLEHRVEFILFFNYSVFYFNDSYFFGCTMQLAWGIETKPRQWKR